MKRSIVIVLLALVLVMAAMPAAAQYPYPTPPMSPSPSVTPTFAPTAWPSVTATAHPTITKYSPTSVVSGARMQANILGQNLLGCEDIGVFTVGTTPAVGAHRLLKSADGTLVTFDFVDWVLRPGQYAVKVKCDGVWIPAGTVTVLPAKPPPPPSGTVTPSPTATLVAPLPTGVVQHRVHVLAAQARQYPMPSTTVAPSLTPTFAPTVWPSPSPTATVMMAKPLTTVTSWGPVTVKSGGRVEVLIKGSNLPFCDRVYLVPQTGKPTPVAGSGDPVHPAVEGELKFRFDVFAPAGVYNVKLECVNPPVILLGTMTVTPGLLTPTAVATPSPVVTGMPTGIAQRVHVLAAPARQYYPSPMPSTTATSYPTFVATAWPSPVATTTPTATTTATPTTTPTRPSGFEDIYDQTWITPEFRACIGTAQLAYDHLVFLGTIEDNIVNYNTLVLGACARLVPYLTANNSPDAAMNFAKQQKLNYEGWCASTHDPMTCAIAAIWHDVYLVLTTMM